VSQLIVATVAERVGVMETAREFLERRAGSAKPKDVLNYIAQGATRGSRARPERQRIIFALRSHTVQGRGVRAGEAS
jgi:hypothetical protein